MEAQVNEEEKLLNSFEFKTLTITLVTSYGCVACQIQHKLICEFIAKLKNCNVIYKKLDYVDFKASNNNSVKNFMFDDFPITIFNYNDHNTIVCGTKPMMDIVKEHNSKVLNKRK